MAHIVTCSSNQKCNEEKLSLTSPAEQAPEEEVTPDKKAAPPAQPTSKLPKDTKDPPKGAKSKAPLNIFGFVSQCLFVCVFLCSTQMYQWMSLLKGEGQDVQGSQPAWGPFVSIIAMILNSLFLFIDISM